jgi:hypothetical protein
MNQKQDDVSRGQVTHEQWNRIREHFPSNRVNKKTQVGRRLRRYERRWSVARFSVWMQWHRRLLVRWEYQRSSAVLYRLSPAPLCLNDFEMGFSHHQGRFAHACR